MTVSVIGNPVAIELKPYTFDALQEAIDSALPEFSGAAFVRIDTRVLAALIAPERREAPAMLEALRDFATHPLPYCETDAEKLARLDDFMRKVRSDARAILARIDGEA